MSEDLWRILQNTGGGGHRDRWIERIEIAPQENQVTLVMDVFLEIPDFDMSGGSFQGRLGRDLGRQMHDSAGNAIFFTARVISSRMRKRTSDLQEKSKSWNVDISVACYVHTIMGGTIHPDPLLLKGSTILGYSSHSEEY